MSRRRRQRVSAEQVEDVLGRTSPLLIRLPPAVWYHHREATAELTGRWRFEGARGFDVTDEARIVVAGHAALLVAGLDEGAALFDAVTSVILHRSTIVLRGPHQQPGGLVSDGPAHLAGQAHHRGPVVLSWAATRRESLHPERGQHVVLHEMAHRLDMLDGITDGTPPLGDERLVERWTDVCTRALQSLRSGTPSPVLRQYAATNPAEFFAVATEAFCCRPVELRAAHPDLYVVLADFYRLDPATWPPPPAPSV